MDFVEPINLVQGHDDSDCAITAIQMVTGLTYREVVRSAVVGWPMRAPDEGLTNVMIKSVLQSLGFSTKFKKRVDWDEDYGIVRLTDHCVVLKNGSVIDALRGGIAMWDADAFIKTRRDQVLGIFVAVGR
jgi:hypothetical protein